MNRPVGNKFLVLTLLLYHLVAGVQEIEYLFGFVELILSMLVSVGLF